jgi:hypothetical protein
VRDCRVQLEKAFVLISSKVQLGTVSCKECAGQREISLRVVILSEAPKVKDCCCKVCAESEEVEHWKCL